MYFPWQRKKFLVPALRALLLASSLFMFAFAMFSPIYAIFVQKIGGGVVEASRAWALFGLTAGLLTFICGRLENKMKEVELAIVWSQLLIGLAYVAFYFTRSVNGLYVVMIILGIGEALYWPAFHALYGRHVDGRKSTWLWGVYDGLTYIVPAFGSALGGWLVAIYGFGIIFMIMAALSFLNAIFIFLLPRRVL